MKVIHVLNGSVPLVAGYTSRAKYIVDSQKNLNIDPIVITSLRQGPTLTDVEIIDGVKYFRTNWSQSIFTCFKNIKLTRLLAEVMAFLKRINNIRRLVEPEIIHAHSPILCAFPAFIVSKIYNLPFVYEIRALWEDAAVDSGATKENSLRYYLTRAIETRLARYCDQLVVICNGLKDELIKRGVQKDKIHVVRNGVDCKKFKLREKNKKLIKNFSLNEKMVIGYIGTFYKFEGVKYIIRALEKICKIHDNVAGLIIGGGETETDLIKLRDKFNLQKKIIMPGWIPHNEIGEYYDLIDIFVYPRISRRITELVTPLKPLEAMAMEKIVLASDVGGMRELVINGKNGFLFNSGNLNDLVNKLSWIIENRNLWKKIGKNAREWIMYKHDWIKNCESYIVIYEKAINS